MSCSDVIGTETVQVLLATLEVISVTYKNIVFRRKSEILLFKFFLPKTKPLIDRIIYRPPNQSNYLGIINANFDKLDTDTKKLRILGDFSTNMYQNNKYITRFLQSFFLAILKIINTMHGLKQLIK